LGASRTFALWLAPLLGLDCVVACRGDSQADPVILSLGAESVRRSDFERHLHTLEARSADNVDPAVRRALLEPFLEERVLVLEARGRGLVKPGVSPEEEVLAVRRLLEAEVLSGREVRAEEVDAFYADQAQDFSVPETVVLRQILVPTEGEARDVVRRLQNEPRGFATLAQSRSHSPEASQGGLMGRFARGQLPPELDAAAFALPVGGTSGIIATPLGYHVLRVDEHQPSRQRSVEECREEIRARLGREKSDQATRQFVRGLLARAKVNHEALEDPRS